MEKTVKEVYDYFMSNTGDSDDIVYGRILCYFIDKLLRADSDSKKLIYEMIKNEPRLYSI